MFDILSPDGYLHSLEKQCLAVGIVGTVGIGPDSEKV